MTDLERAIEDVHMTIVTADALECRQATFNVKSVSILLNAFCTLHQAAEGVLKEIGE